MGTRCERKANYKRAEEKKMSVPRDKEKEMKINRGRTEATAAMFQLSGCR